MLPRPYIEVAAGYKSRAAEDAIPGHVQIAQRSQRQNQVDSSLIESLVECQKQVLPGAQGGHGNFPGVMQGVAVGAQGQQVVGRVRTAIGDWIEVMNVEGDDVATYWVAALVAGLVKYELPYIEGYLFSPSRPTHGGPLHGKCLPNLYSSELRCYPDRSELARLFRRATNPGGGHNPCADRGLGHRYPAPQPPQ